MSRTKTKGPAAAAPKQTAILLAVGELRGGGEVIADGDELTAEKLAALKLEDEDVAELIERGKIARVLARQAEAVGADDLAQAEQRAVAAEAHAAALQKEVDELKIKLAASSKPAQ